MPPLTAAQSLDFRTRVSKLASPLCDRQVNEFPVRQSGSGATSRVKCSENAISPSQLIAGRREDLIDDWHLPRVNCRLAEETQAPRRQRFLLQAIIVINVGVHTVTWRRLAGSPRRKDYR